MCIKEENDEQKIKNLLENSNLKKMELEGCCLTIQFLNEMLYLLPHLHTVSFKETQLDETAEESRLTWEKLLEKLKLNAVSIAECGVYYINIISGLYHAKQIKELILHDVEKYTEIESFVQQQTNLEYVSINLESFFDIRLIKMKKLQAFDFHSIRTKKHIKETVEYFQNFNTFIEDQTELEKISLGLSYLEDEMDYSKGFASDYKNFSSFFLEQFKTANQEILAYFKDSFKQIVKLIKLKELKINLIHPETILRRCRLSKISNENVEFLSLCFNKNSPGPEECRLTKALMYEIKSVFPKLKSFEIDFENSDHPKFGCKLSQLSFSQFVNLKELNLDHVLLLDFPFIPKVLPESIEALRVRLDSEEIPDFTKFKSVVSEIIKEGKNLKELVIKKKNSTVKLSDENCSEIVDLMETCQNIQFEIFDVNVLVSTKMKNNIMMKYPFCYQTFPTFHPTLFCCSHQKHFPVSKIPKYRFQTTIVKDGKILPRVLSEKVSVRCNLSRNE